MTDSFHILGLERLSSARGVDVRQTVLRVATELFCETATHRPEDVARYVDLACALLDVVDAETRLAVAEKLALAPHAPDVLIRRLLRDPDVKVASVILATMPQMPCGDVAGFLGTCGPAEAAALAWRNDLDTRAVHLLAAHPHPLVPNVLVKNRTARLDLTTLSILAKRAPFCGPLGTLLFERDDVPALMLAPLYLQAPPQTRARIREAFIASDRPDAPALAPRARRAVARAVNSRDLSVIAEAMAEAFSADVAGMQRIIRDPSGEMFLLSLAGAGYSKSAAIAVMLLSAPAEVRDSAEAMYAAAELYENIPPAAARSLVVAVAGERRRAHFARHEPFMHASASPQRGSGSPGAPRPTRMASHQSERSKA